MSAATTAAAVTPEESSRTGDPRPAALLAVVLGASALALLFHDTVVSIVAMWWRSETFTHGFFVLPLFLWLLWRERGKLAAMPLRTDALPLPLIAGAGLLWLLARVAGVLAAEQLAFVVMLILLIWSLVGREIAREIRFPLLFLLFLAPLGEELVPLLMELTADLTVGAVVLTGIPIYREGLFFSLPSGDWSVVEACSGVRYLLASLMLGSLYAYLSYRSVSRRALFIALSLLAPIAANGVRAFLIVMIGHVSGMRLAAGADHLVYGWVFFGIVMFLLFGIGALIAEPDDGIAATASATARLANGHGRDPTPRSTLRHAALLALCVGVWPLWAAQIERTLSDEASVDEADLARLLPAEVAADATPVTDWRPRIDGHDAALEAHLDGADGERHPTVLALAYLYAEQYQGKEMISSSNVLVRSDDPRWRRVGRDTATLERDGTTLEVERTRLRSAEQELLVWRWYRVGDAHTGDALRAKLLEMRARLLLERPPSVAYLLAVDARTARARVALETSAIRIVAEGVRERR